MRTLIFLLLIIATCCFSYQMGELNGRMQGYIDATKAYQRHKPNPQPRGAYQAVYDYIGSDSNYSAKLDTIRGYWPEKSTQ
jgi:hypothetical protein